MSVSSYPNVPPKPARRYHGLSKTKEYRVWWDMKKRCTYPALKCWPHYGGRGIKVCDRWNFSFESFLDDMGPIPPGHSLDRIDNDGDYEPGNCRWVTQKVQLNNRRANRWVVHDGLRMSVADWAAKAGLPYHVMRKRLNKGWPMERILGTPLMESFSHARAA